MRKPKIDVSKLTEEELRQELLNKLTTVNVSIETKQKITERCSILKKSSIVYLKELIDTDFNLSNSSSYNINKKNNLNK